MVKARIKFVAYVYSNGKHKYKCVEVSNAPELTSWLGREVDKAAVDALMDEHDHTDVTISLVGRNNS